MAIDQRKTGRTQSQSSHIIVPTHELTVIVWENQVFTQSDSLLFNTTFTSCRTSLYTIEDFAIDVFNLGQKYSFVLASEDSIRELGELGLRADEDGGS